MIQDISKNTILLGAIQADHERAEQKRKEKKLNGRYVPLALEDGSIIEHTTTESKDAPNAFEALISVDGVHETTNMNKLKQYAYKFDASDSSLIEPLSDEQNLSIFERTKTNPTAEKKLNSVTTAQPGFQYSITTLSYIFAGLVSQKYAKQGNFDKLFPAIRQGGWATEVIRNAGRLNIDSDMTTYELNASSNQSLKQVQVELSHMKFPVSTFGFQTNFNLIATQQASMVNLDIITSTLEQAKAAYQTNIERACFVGSSSGSISGVLTNPNVTTNTTLITQPISTMSPTQINAVLSTAIPEAYGNTSQAIAPDTFIMPDLDGAGQGAFLSPPFPIISIKEAIKNGLKLGASGLTGANGKALTEEDFMVETSPYCSENINGLGTTYYLMYNRSASCIEALEPIPFTTLLTVSVDGGFTLSQSFYGRHGGVNLIIPTTMLRFQY